MLFPVSLRARPGGELNIVFFLHYKQNYWDSANLQHWNPNQLRSPI